MRMRATPRAYAAPTRWRSVGGSAGGETCGVALTRLPAPQLVERSADPPRVRRALERIAARRPDLAEELEDRRFAEALVAVLAASRNLGALVARDDLALACLHDLGVRAAVPAPEAPFDD